MNAEPMTPGEVMAIALALFVVALIVLGVADAAVISVMAWWQDTWRDKRK